MFSHSVDSSQKEAARPDNERSERERSLQAGKRDKISAESRKTGFSQLPGNS